MMSSNFRPAGFNYLPEVVKHIIIINVLFYIVRIALIEFTYNDINNSMGLHYPGSPEFRPFQFITYMFLHGNLFHIFFNLFAIWLFGSVIEQVMGSPRFLIYYLITGIGAAILHILVDYIQINPTIQAIDALLANPDINAFTEFTNSKYFKTGSLHPDRLYSEVDRIGRIQAMQPGLTSEAISNFLTVYRHELLRTMPVVVGASGSLFGILLAFGLLFPNTYIYLYFAIPVKAKYFVTFYALFELFLGVANTPGDNVAHFAHLGGLVFGFILIKAWGLDKHKNRFG